MDISRRGILAAGIAVPLSAMLASCTTPPPKPVPTTTPTPTPTLTPTTDTPGLSTSYGPNGTHFPADTPWLGSAGTKELEVDCSWTAISRAVQWFTDEEVNAGAIVRVRPGVLVGAGGGSRKSPVLDGIGNPAWTRNVLICPRDGYGTVTVEKQGFRINNCHRLSIFGFKGPTVDGFATNCTMLRMGWSEWGGLSFTQSGANIELYELVLGFRRNPNDTFAVRPTDENAMTDIRRFGCVFGPSVKPADSESHCDTLQLERTGSGAFGPFYSEDCVDFGSSNAAVLGADTLSSMEFRHCLILGERLPWTIFPLQDGDYDGEPNAFAGGCPDVRLYDSIVVGPLGRLGYTTVESTSISYSPASKQEPSASGSWNVDNSLNGWTAQNIIDTAGTDFTPASYAAAWVW